MDVKTKAFVSGGMALVLSVVIIVSATLLGFAPVGGRTLIPNGSGTLSILLTDPASVPEGVTAVFFTFNNLRVHSVGFPSDAGWIGLNSTGTIETLGLVNQSEIITSANIPSGTYDSVSLEITTSQVELQGKNYSATVYGAPLVAPFIGMLTVKPSGDNAALVDLQPTILNLGSPSVPQFVVSTAAKAVEVPSGQVNLESRGVGSRISLASNSWFASFTTNNTEHLAISSESVTSHSLSLNVNNPGRGPVMIKMVIVTPVLAVAVRSSSASPPLMESAVFVVEANGTLQFVQFIGPSVLSIIDKFQALINSSGYELPPGASLSFAYSGPMTLSFGGNTPFGSKTPATFYMITVLGNQVLARTSVKGS